MSRSISHKAWTALFAASALFQFAAAAQPHPDVIWDDTTLYRDEWGTPHIYAADLFTAAYALGYAQADDHPEVLLKAFRVANGRAAEVYGEDYADSDAFAIMIGHGALARLTYPSADDVTRQLCEGFAAGANAWYERHPALTPGWADPVRPEDPLALMHCFLMSHAPLDMPDAIGRPPGAKSGNAWAVAPSRSESGQAMLVMNPHTHYYGPFQWYEAHMAFGEDGWSMSGATLVGLPVLMMGHNGRIGWALSPHEADTADVFVEPDPASGDGGGGGRNAGVITSGGPPIPPGAVLQLQLARNMRTYRVQTANGMETREAPYFDTDRGPFIGLLDGRFCTWSVGGYRDFGTIRQLYWMGRSANLNEFQQAMSLHQLPSFHVVYADADGNLFYGYSAKVGDKRDPAPAVNEDAKMFTYLEPIPAADTRYRWDGIVPIERLPMLTNPASGYVQACGNPPWTVTDNAGLDRGSFPAWFGAERDTHRARRVRQMLSRGSRTFQDMQSMVFDVLVPFGMTAVPRILQTVDSSPEWAANASPEAADLATVLRNWNFLADESSEGMTAFHVWWTAFRALASNTMSDEDVLQAIVTDSAEVRASTLRALEQAARAMTTQFNSTRVRWGDVHVIGGGEPSPIAGAATGYPIFTTSDQRFANGAWHADYGFGFAMAVRFGTYVEAVSLLPFGISSRAESPHNGDQLVRLREGRMKPAWFYREEVLPNSPRAFGRKFTMVARGLDATCEVSAITPVEARLTTSLVSPGALPRNRAAYTLFAEYTFDPPESQAAMEVTMRVPEEFRRGRGIDAFSVSQFAGSQWTSIPSQQRDAGDGTIRFTLTEPSRFVLLGPERPGMTVAQVQSPEPSKPSPSTESGQTAPSGEKTTPAPVTAMFKDWPGRNARSGAISWGRTVSLRPPALEGLFSIESSESIGARLTTTPELPRALPAGMAAFSPFVLVECSQPGTPMSVAIDLRPNPGSCDAADLPMLGIYACDAANDWERLAPQQFESELGRFVATDDRPRVYVLLGPAASLRTP